MPFESRLSLTMSRLRRMSETVGTCTVGVCTVTVGVRTVTVGVRTFGVATRTVGVFTLMFGAFTLMFGAFTLMFGVFTLIFGIFTLMFCVGVKVVTLAVGFACATPPPRLWSLLKSLEPRLETPPVLAGSFDMLAGPDRLIARDRN